MAIGRHLVLVEPPYNPYRICTGFGFQPAALGHACAELFRAGKVSVTVGPVLDIVRSMELAAHCQRRFPLTISGIEQLMAILMAHARSSWRAIGI